MEIKEVIIHGRKDFCLYLKTYTVEYSSIDLDNINTKKFYKNAYTEYGNKRFYDYVRFPFKARFIKIYPITWDPYLGLRACILIDSQQNDKIKFNPVPDNFFYYVAKKIINKCDLKKCKTCFERDYKCT